MARRGAAGEDLSNVEFETSEDVEVVPTFNSMGLREELLRAIYAYGTFIFHTYFLHAKKHHGRRRRRASNLILFVHRRIINKY